MNPPGTPVIVGWASYAAVLDGGPIFVCRQNVVTGRWRQLEGQGMSPAAQDALAVGCDYFWEHRSRSKSTALLWRTNEDLDTAAYFSGSVLCLGQIAHNTARAVVFQNYEAPLRPEHVRSDHRHLLSTSTARSPNSRAWFKGGFLLPDEVRQADIQMEDGSKE